MMSGRNELDTRMPRNGVSTVMEVLPSSSSSLHASVDFLDLFYIFKRMNFLLFL